MLTVKFESNFDSDPSFDFLQGEVHEFTGKVQNCLRGGVHLPPLPPPPKKTKSRHVHKLQRYGT
jgi:hypothetical protein